MDGHAVADPTETTDTGDKLKVFVSYSRAQVHFADEVVLSLEDKGHAPLIDRHTIAKGEDFKPRLGELILKADTVVFILSDESASSTVCAWEVEEAARLAKRILVVTLGDLSPGITPPEKLAGIDWIHCWANPAVPGSSQTRGFIELDQALRTDLGWLRKQTELQEQAAKWDARGRVGDDPVLLREDLLAEGLDWSRSAPTGQAVPALVAAFLKASDQAEATRKAEAAANLDARERAVAEAAQAVAAARRASGRLRTVGLIGAGVAAAFLSAALVLGWYATLGARDVARQSSNILATESRTIYDGGNGDVASSLLMALQADPAAVRDLIGRRFDHKTGYAFARARMEAGHINNPLAQVFTGHEGPVTAVALAPGGRLVTGSSDGTARLWDLETGAELRAFTGHGDWVRAVAVAPGGRLVTGSNDGSARLWDLQTGEELKAFKGAAGVSSVAVLPSGDLVASFDNGLVQLWDLGTGDMISAFTAYERDWLTRLFSDPTRPPRAHIQIVQASASRLVTRSIDGTIRLWDVESGTEVNVIRANDSRFLSIAMAPGGRLVSGANDGKAQLWDLDTGEELQAFTGHGYNVTAVAVAPEGRLVTGASDGKVRLWDFETGKILLSFKAHYGDIKSILTFGDLIVTHANDGVARLWDVGSEEHLLAFVGHKGAVSSVAVSPGALLVTGSWDRTARLWNLETGEELLVFKDHKSEVLSAALAPRGGLVTGSKDGTIRLWDPENGEQLRAFTGDDSSAVDTIAFTDDGRVVTSAILGKVSLLDLETGEKQHVPGPDFGSSPFLGRELVSRYFLGMDAPIAVSSPGQLVANSDDGFLSLWNLDPIAVSHSFIDHDLAMVSAVAVAPGGRLVTGSWDGTVQFWDLETGVQLRAFAGFGPPILFAAAAPFGRTLIRDGSGATRLLNSDTGDELYVFSGASDASSVNLTADGRLVTGHGDGTVRLWEMPEILREDDPRAQVRMACEQLHDSGFKLAFTRADAVTYPVLLGQPTDPETGDFRSPCRCFLPDEVFETEANKCPVGLPGRGLFGWLGLN